MAFAGLGNMALSAAEARSGFLTDLAKFKEQTRLQYLAMLQQQAQQIKQERAQRAEAKRARQTDILNKSIGAGATLASGGLGLLAAPAAAAPAALAGSAGTTNLMQLQNMLDNDFKIGLGR